MMFLQNLFCDNEQWKSGDLRLNLVCGKGKRSFSRVHNATDNQNSRADRDNHVTIGNNNDNIEVLLPQIRQKFVRVPWLQSFSSSQRSKFTEATRQQKNRPRARAAIKISPPTRLLWDREFPSSKGQTGSPRKNLCKGRATTREIQKMEEGGLRRATKTDRRPSKPKP